jgi:hypothetical protein
MSGANTGVLIDIRDELFRRDVEQLYARGPRPFFELLRELAATRLLRTEIEELVRRYARLDRTALNVLGADQMPPR